MKQGSSHRRTVSENQDHSTLDKEAWTTNQQHGRPLLVGDKLTLLILKIITMTLDFLNTTTATNIQMNSDYVEIIKATLEKSSKSVELTIKNIDNMLGLRVQIINSGNDKCDLESAIDEAFFDAVLKASVGDMDALYNYKAEGHSVRLGTDLKLEVLEAFLSSNFPVEANIFSTKMNSTMLEVTFQFGYRRKLRIYFSAKDVKAIERLRLKGLIPTEA